MSQVNILVDKDGTPHLAGLGNAYVLPGSIAWTMEDRTAADRAHAPQPTVPGIAG